MNAPATDVSPLISPQLKRAVREYLVANFILREISEVFDDAGISPDRTYTPQVSGERRALIEQYYKTLDFSKSEDCKRFLRFVFAIATNSRYWESEAFKVIFEVLEKEGYVFSNDELCKRKDKRTISELTRRNLIESINFPWWGRLEEVAFLNRLYPLNSLPSTDSRFPNAEGDIYQHRYNNDDWPNDWVFSYPSFDLMDGPDEIFLKFLCETIHPVVRSKIDEAQEIVQLFNEHLKHDGWEIVASGEISGHPVWAARMLHQGMATVVEGAKAAVETLNSGYVSRQITRMQNAVIDDPELAIGTAKEFIETICKTILEVKQIPFSKTDGLPQLVRKTLKQIKLTPDDIRDSAKVSDTIKQLLMNLATVTDGLAEVRNAYGSGHGKTASTKGLQPRHARLSVGAAITLGGFIFETFQEQEGEIKIAGKKVPSE